MNKVILTIVLFALAIALVIGVIIPVTTSGKSAGQGAKDKMDDTQSNISTLSAPVTFNVHGFEVITDTVLG